MTKQKINTVYDNMTIFESFSVTDLSSVFKHTISLSHYTFFPVKASSPLKILNVSNPAKKSIRLTPPWLVKSRDLINWPWTPATLLSFLHKPYCHSWLLTKVSLWKGRKTNGSNMFSYLTYFMSNFGKRARLWMECCLKELWQSPIQILRLLHQFHSRHEFISSLIPLKATCVLCHLPRGALQMQLYQLSYRFTSTGNQVKAVFTCILVRKHILTIYKCFLWTWILQTKNIKN